MQHNKVNKNISEIGKYCGDSTKIGLMKTNRIITVQGKNCTANLVPELHGTFFKEKSGRLRNHWRNI